MRNEGWIIVKKGIKVKNGRRKRIEIEDDERV